MKVLTFSRVFPAYHPKAGQPTYFREKIWAGLADTLPDFKIPDNCIDWDWHEYYNAIPKHHTIRAGNRWKVGDFFSPRVWSGKPYASKQIEFAPPIQVKKVWDIVFVQADEHLTVGEFTYYPNGYEGMIKLLAQNDGLTVEDFKAWFKKPFTGQIICWNENINY